MLHHHQWLFSVIPKTDAFPTPMEYIYLLFKEPNFSQFYSHFTCVVQIVYNNSCKCEEDGLSATGITLLLYSYIALPVGVVIGLGVALYGMRHGQGPASEGGQRKNQQLHVGSYL